ncbi:MAG: FKBP-type peptidyl-prolyl cis-trans isomerase [Desulfurococcales archaeon]|nr:FKBP-type peptidyl-prolyl cis-trans isomerase [Desulfurococcales archaeon]
MSDGGAARLALIRYKIYAIDDDGSEVLVDTTEEEEARKHGLEAAGPFGPRLVIIGKSRLIDAVEEALREMGEGDEREFIAPPEKAYGLRDERKVIRVPIKQLRRSGIRPIVGQEVEVGSNRGRIVRVTERFAYIDFNHPLAGKKLRVWVKVEKELRDTQEKAQYLVERWLYVKPVNVSFDNGVLTIEMPSEVLAQKDLEAKLALLLRDITDAIPEASEIVYTFRFKVKPKEERKAEEKQLEENANPAGEEAGGTSNN